MSKVNIVEFVYVIIVIVDLAIGLGSTACDGLVLLA